MSTTASPTSISTTSSSSSSSLGVTAYFHYSPSEGAATAFLVFYSIASLICLLPTLKYRWGSWFMLIVFVTGVCEWVGFYERMYLAHNVNNTTFSAETPYIIMSTLQVISPNALALCNYLILSRLLTISAIAEPHFLLRPAVVAPIFLSSDILSFAIQGGASGFLVQPDTAQLGANLMIVGLVVQLVFFSIFTYITYTVHYHSTYAHLHTSIPTVHRIMRCLWFTIGMLYVRSIYRLIEFSSGFDGVVATTESLVYVFDSTPVLLCFFVYSYDHFGLLKNEYLAALTHKTLPDEKHERATLKQGRPVSCSSAGNEDLHAIAMDTAECVLTSNTINVAQKV